MASPIFSFGEPRNFAQSRFTLLETLVDARANAQCQFFSEMRRTMGGMPILEAGLQFAEIVAKQQRDFGHMLIHQMQRVASSREFAAPWGNRQYAPEAGAEQSSYDKETSADAAGAATPLRLFIPLGAQAAAVPLQLRNHRRSVDIVSLSAAEPVLTGVPVISSDLIHFDP
jgi:hypothetical protein